MKNIRQAHNELQKKYDELAEAHLILQRTLKRLLLHRKRSIYANNELFYSYSTAQYYTDNELDNIQIDVFDHQDEERVELRIEV